MLIRVNDWLKASLRRQKRVMNSLEKQSTPIYRDYDNGRAPFLPNFVLWFY